MIRPDPEHICANCGDYGFKSRTGSGGWAYCYHWQKWFPKQHNWTDKTPPAERVKPAGKRTCNNWKKKGGDN